VIVEDNRDAADSLRMLLELLGHQVASRTNGPEGVRLARSGGLTSSSAISGLPGMDGYGVAVECAGIRQRRGRP